ncbi:hypothetical protein [Streptomyces canus]|uniref:hypothetical protein n=1 Tax=Streptomyces canus TaxID=58343 RepID=UPI00277DF0DE|nr:hypothetical protein [Streptomyces canus]MDQ1065923.1 hypothetical protein [Streptomyces canus]
MRRPGRKWSWSAIRAPEDGDGEYSAELTAGVEDAVGGPVRWVGTLLTSSAVVGA